MRARLVLLATLAALMCAPAAAHAHPLGNFSVNHLTEVSVSAERVDVRYILDQAEVPTFQQRGVAQAEVLRGIRAEVARGVRVTVDGRAAPLTAVGPPRLALRPGSGGLKTTRFELALRAPARDARSVVLRDDTYGGRVGWRAIVARPGRGTAVRTGAPASDPTRRLTRYPEALLESPADLRMARFDVRPGDGTLVAAGARSGGRGGGGADGFAGLFADAAAGEGVLILLLLAAFGWGAVHALSPGHGKAMVAAYLVGTRGTPRHAVALGATVTVTHTAGVVLLGVVALTLSQYVLPEDLYPWLNLVAGLLVLGVGAAVLRSRLTRRHHHHHHHHHDHDHAPPERLSARGLLAMGASAGLIPCPSALVVLLGAVAQHQIALGLVLIVAFSAGLAATLTALGLAVVWTSRAAGRLPVPGRALAALPTASALVIVGVGVLLTLQAVPQVT
ncbi:MAG TPA: sulfite exporter TauE/SafE family protein [Solirubrobacteraceae bacterium]|nr:sulfite exporter TauE/SafE family protein [Solirubrobacteraceae bacterium]